MRRVPPVSAPLPRYPENMHGDNERMAAYDRRHPERNAAAFAAYPDSRPRSKWTVEPRSYIPSAHLTPAQRELCLDRAEEINVAYAYAHEQDLLARNRARQPRRNLTPYLIALAPGLAFIGGLLAGRIS